MVAEFTELIAKLIQHNATEIIIIITRSGLEVPVLQLHGDERRQQSAM